ncbi:MAG TPA: hypothetical protein VLZ75_04040 [Chitinophagales bacterium]|nr:hypothetical protein [Chitinophagales bacterium]
MKLKVFSIYIFALNIPIAVFAQNRDSLKTDEINVVRAFEPEVNLVNKVDFPPNLPVISTNEKPANQVYQFNDFYKSIEYTPEDLRPLKYSASEETPSSVGYVKAGFGNYLTPVFKLALANKDHSKFQTGLDVDFIHSKSKNPKFRQYYELGIQGYGEYHLENITVGARLGMSLNQYYLYGMDATEADTLNKSDLSRKYTIPKFGVYFYNHSANRWDMNFAGNLDVEIASTDFSNKGVNVKYGLHGLKEFSGDTYKVGLDIDGMISSNTNSENSISRNALALKPFAGIKKDIWSLEAGPVLIIDDGDVHVLPYIKNKIKIKDDLLVMYNEWNSKIGYNNLINTSRENPFIANNIRFENYRFQERTIIGLRGALPSGFSYDARFGQNVWSDAPLYVNDTNDMKQFTQIIEEKVSAWNGHVEVEYEKAGQFGAKTSFDYYAYKTKSGSEAWHMPTLKFSLSGKYIWNDKLFVGAEVIALGGIKARNQQLNVEKLSPQVDINLSANYHLTKNIGFFVELNNLLNNTQPRYNLYERFGFQGIGGVKIIF